MRARRARVWPFRPDDRMKLLFVSHSLPPVDRPMSNVGGMQRVAAELHDALSRDRSIDYDAVLLRATWSQTHWRTPLFLLRTWLTLWFRAVRGEIDVVLFSSMVTATLVWPLAGTFRRRGIRMGAIVHGLDVTNPFFLWQWLIRRVFRRVDLVLPVSSATGLECLSRGLPEEKLRPVRNGVDIRRFLPLVSAPTARRRLVRQIEDVDFPLPESDGLLLVSVGRHVRRKGFEWFVRNVMPLLPRDVHYWIAGDGPETPAVRSAIFETEVADRVRLLGRISEDDLHVLYRGADLFVMPNVPVPGDMEGFGVVMLEAGLGGLTTVGSNLEGIAEVITEGANGYLVESGVPKGFAEAIMLHYGNAERRLRATHHTYTHTRRHFGWKAVSAEYVRVLSALDQGEPIPAPEAIVAVPAEA